MSKKIRLLSLLLALLMVVSVFAACGNNEDTQKETGDTTAGQTENVTDPVEDALTELRGEVDWGGNDFGIIYVNDIGGYTEEVEAEPENGDETGSGVINDAVFERNTLFEEYCNLNFVLVPTPNPSIGSAIMAEVQTGTGDFHLITTTADTAARNATSGYLYNYLDLDIDLEQPWWDAGTLEFALDGRVFFMDGPFNIVDDDVTFVFMFNKVSYNF